MGLPDAGDRHGARTAERERCVLTLIKLVVAVEVEQPSGLAAEHAGFGASVAGPISGYGPVPGDTPKLEPDAGGIREILVAGGVENPLIAETYDADAGDPLPAEPPSVRP